MTPPEHSITNHPLKELLTPEEWEQLLLDVQLCRVSWPQCWVLVTTPEYAEGYAAYLPDNKCPYKPGSMERTNWIDGWWDALVNDYEIPVDSETATE